MGIVSIVTTFAKRVRAEISREMAEQREFFKEMTPDERAEFEAVMIVNGVVPGAPVYYDATKIHARVAAKKRAAALVAQ